MLSAVSESSGPMTRGTVTGRAGVASGKIRRGRFFFDDPAGRDSPAATWRSRRGDPEALPDPFRTVLADVRRRLADVWPRLPDHRRVVADARRVPADDRHLVAEDRQGPAEDRQGPAEDRQGPAEDRQGPAEDRQGPAEDRQGPAEDRQPLTDVCPCLTDVRRCKTRRERGVPGADAAFPARSGSRMCARSRSKTLRRGSCGPADRSSGGVNAPGTAVRRTAATGSGGSRTAPSTPRGSRRTVCRDVPYAEGRRSGAPRTSLGTSKWAVAEAPHWHAGLRGGVRGVGTVS